MVKVNGAWLIKWGGLMLVLVAGWLWYRHQYVPEKVICRRLHRAAEVFSKAGKENPGILALKMGSIEKLIADQVVCDVISCPFNGTHSVTAFTSMTFRSRALAERLQIALGEMECVLETNERATVRCMAKVSFVSQGRYANDDYPCCIQMVKMNGGWRIAAIRNDRLIQK